MKTKTIIIVIIIMAILIGMNMKKEATLPAGEIYSDSGCTFISNTNIHQADTGDVEEIRDFGVIYTTWIAVDWNNDSTKEGYGYMGSASGGDTCSSKPLITHTPGGLRVVKYYDASWKEVGICSGDGNLVYRFSDNDADALDAVLVCGSSCTSMSDVMSSISSWKSNPTSATMQSALDKIGAYKIGPC